MKAKTNLPTPLISAFILSGFFASTCFADTTLNYAGADHQSSFQIAHNNMRLNYDKGGQKGFLLYSGADNKIYLVDVEKEQYMELEQMVSQVVKMKDQMSQMLAQQMKGLSAEEKAQMQKMMGSVLGGIMGEPEPTAAKDNSIKIERTGVNETVGKFSCERLRINTASDKSTEVCVATPSEVGLSDKDTQTMQNWMGKMGEIGERLSEMMPSDNAAFAGINAELQGVPLKTYDESAMELTSVDFSKIEKALMVIPENYTAMSSPLMQ